MRAVDHASALGYGHLDTAQGYFNEAEVGAGLRRVVDGDGLDWER